MAVNLKLEVAGAGELRTKLQKLDSELKMKIREKLAEVGALIRERARELAPVRTGMLKAGIYSQLTDWTLKIGAKAPYARYVEFGTRWIRPRHFLLNAIEENLIRIENAFHEAVSSAVSEAST